MKYSGSLVKAEREKIFELFLNKHKLKFSQIEKDLKIRSNMVSYHLECMVKDALLKKSGEYYELTKEAEKYIPIFSNITGKELAATPALLVAIVHKDRVLLLKRDKRPYKGYWGIIGGKLRFDQDVEAGSVKLALEKTGLKTSFSSLNSVMHESVMDEGTLKHSFLSLFTVVRAKDVNIAKPDTKWVKVKDLAKEDIIPSDLWLLKKKLRSKTSMVRCIMHEKEGRITGFDIKSK
jgi:ADP-ribose pyrophosphatase YjhB (NUDIX family)